MADLKIIEKNGYEELDDAQNAISSKDLDIKALWKAVADGDTEAAALVLFEAGFGEDGEEPADVKDVIVMSTPDSRLGDRYRVWIRMVESDGR
jgi:hypothetical protein